MKTVLERLIPHNVFASLSSGEILKIVLFFSFFGIALVLIPQRQSGVLFAAMNGLYTAAQWMIGKVLLFFPLGLFALTAVQFSQFGLMFVSSLVSLILLVIIVSLVLLAAEMAVMAVVVRKPLNVVLASMKNMMIIAVGTRSSFAAIPSGLTGLTEGLKLDPGKVEGTFTLGVTLCRFGNIMAIGIASVFAFHLYGETITVQMFFYIAAASVFAAAAGSGAPGIIARTMVGIVLEPVGIPAEIIIIMLHAIDVFIDPFTTLLNVIPNFGAAAMLGSGAEQVHR